MSNETTLAIQAAAEVLDECGCSTFEAGISEHCKAHGDRENAARAAIEAALGTVDLGEVAAQHVLAVNASAGKWECRGCRAVYGRTPSDPGGITVDLARSAHGVHRRAAIRAALLGSAA